MTSGGVDSLVLGVLANLLSRVSLHLEVRARVHLSEPLVTAMVHSFPLNQVKGAYLFARYYGILSQV